MALEVDHYPLFTYWRWNVHRKKQVGLGGDCDDFEIDCAGPAPCNARRSPFPTAKQLAASNLRILISNIAPLTCFVLSVFAGMRWFGNKT
jgi:hypothetical protein